MRWIGMLFMYLSGFFAGSFLGVSEAYTSRPLRERLMHVFDVLTLSELLSKSSNDLFYICNVEHFTSHDRQLPSS